MKFLTVLFRTVFFKTFTSKIPGYLTLPFVLNPIYNFAFRPVQFGHTKQPYDGDRYFARFWLAHLGDNGHSSSTSLANVDSNTLLALDVIDNGLAINNNRSR